MCVDLKTGSVTSKLCLLRPELQEVSAEGKFLDTELLGNEFCGNKRGGNMCNLGCAGRSVDFPFHKEGMRHSIRGNARLGSTLSWSL